MIQHSGLISDIWKHRLIVSEANILFASSFYASFSQDGRRKDPNHQKEDKEVRSFPKRWIHES